MSVELTADRIRDHLRTKYVNPARARHETTIRIVAGDVHRTLQLHNRVPAVCQVLRGRKFLAENHLTIEKVEGPPSGQSTTATFVYRLANENRQSEDDRIRAAWESLRGIAKDVFASLGGGEAFIREGRENFYAPGHDPLDDDWGRK